MNSTKTNKLVRLKDEADSRSGKRSEKKRELARHAITTLGQLGYARTGLRDIAEQSGVSVGVLHYYFDDKVELILYCVQMYKEEFAADLEVVIERGDTPEAAARLLVEGLVRAVANNGGTHTLWYDISAQSMFDPAFRPVVEHIEETLIDICRRIIEKNGLTGASPRALYLGLDGIFRHYLARYVAEAPRSLEDMRQALGDFLAQFVAASVAANAANASAGD